MAYSKSGEENGILYARQDGRVVPTHRSFILPLPHCACQAIVLPSCAGYVAIGFTGIAGKMGPADTYAGWVDGTGAHVIDFSTKQGYSINLPDAQQDAVNVSASISNGVLAVTFSRRLNTAV